MVLLIHAKEGETMAKGRPLKPLDVSPDTRGELEALARSRSLPAGLVSRARIVLLCAEGLDNSAVAARLRVSRQTVGRWRERFRTQGLMGLYDERRPGRPRSISDDTVMTLLQKTLETQPPTGSTHWTCRAMAEATRVSKSTVQRSGPRSTSNLTGRIQLSTDPFFAEKVRDIVGLYLNPPDHAMVLCVDEKSQVQALERTQPLLPLGPATSKARRTATSATAPPPSLPPWTSPPAGFSPSAGRVIATRSPGLPQTHRCQRAPGPGCPPRPRQLQHPQARPRQALAGRPAPLPHPLHPHLRFLAQPGRDLVPPHHAESHPPRLLLFRHPLKERIRHFTDHYNPDARPFVWTPTADSILHKIRNLCMAISGTQH